MPVDSFSASIAAFSAVAAVLVITPGMGTAFLTSTLLHNGRRAGYFAAVGMNAGALTHAIVAISARATLLRRFPQGLTALALAGGTLLIGLGCFGLYRAIVRRGVAPGKVDGARTGSPAAFIGSGFATNLLNAPIALFYLIVVPQYVPRTVSPAFGAAVLSAIHLLMAITFTMAYARVLGGALETLQRPRIRLALDCLTSAILFMVGVRAIVGAT
jgi:threonine/homoserine/homoserine lactone efflux protein